MEFPITKLLLTYLVLGVAGGETNHLQLKYHQW